MSLILSSEPHRNALQKVLNEAYIPQDIEQRTMEHLVGSVITQFWVIPQNSLFFPK